MVWKFLGQLAKAFSVGRPLRGLSDAYDQEPFELNRCLKDVGEKRQKAQAKFERDKHLGTHFTVFEEFDKYLDDRFYQKKLQECYDRYTKVKRAMGQS